MQTADDIALALLGRASLLDVSVPDWGVLAIAMPDVAPPWGEDTAPDRYLSVSIFDNVPRWQSLGPGGKIGQGILQVEVIWPRGLGNIGIRRAAQAVMDHFPKNLIIRQGTARVTINAEPWHGSVIPADAGSSLPVSIPWQASAV